MKRSKWLALFLCVFYLSSVDSLRAEETSIIINIDNPDFRKVLVAVPLFFADKSVSSEVAKNFVTEGPNELTRLLDFSGLFNIIDQKAYIDSLKKFEERHKTKENADWLINLQGLSSEDWDLWRSLGVESLTLASLKQSPSDGLVLSIKTLDVNRRQEIIAKQFQKITDTTGTIRRYADEILTTYTGKSGIFQSRLAFVGRTTREAPKQIFISDFDGSNIQQITKGSEPHLSPSWSPDARYLTYTTFENRRQNIYVYDTRTQTTRRLTSSTEGVTSGANWSHNGKLIAFSASRGAHTDIHVITPAGTNQRILIRGSSIDVDPKFSPNGRFMAFVSGRFGNPHIFAAKLDWPSDTNVRVTGDQRLTYAGWYNSTPDWSPDSDRIAFGGYDRDINRYDIFLVDPDGKNMERLTLMSGDNESPSWSPNGQLIAFQSNRIDSTNNKGPANIFVMNRDGSSQRPLSIKLYDAQTPAWSSQRK